MTLLLTVLKPRTLVILQQPMPPTEMPRTEPTITNDTLRRVLAVLVATADLARPWPRRWSRARSGTGIGTVGVGVGSGGAVAGLDVDDAAASEGEG
jgi:hypothetical protein